MAKIQTARLAATFDPLPVWRLLTSVRFAIGLITFLALASLIGVVIPQAPAGMRDNPVAMDVWLDSKRDTFGFATEAMDRLGLFTVFDSPWFIASLGLLVVTVSVCTANRFLPTWRNVFRPPLRVPDAFFERSKNRRSLPAGAGVAQLAAELRRARYRVVETREGGVTYLFADRFAWAQLATFVSHLALILFLAGGLVSMVTGFEENLFIAEGTTQPVFPVSHERQIQVEAQDVVGLFDAAGRPEDFRSTLVIYENGVEVARGDATVNDPLKYGGYRFHQAMFEPNGAALRVRDAATGRTVYAETLALQDTFAAPRVRITDGAGNTVLEDTIVPSDFLGSASGTVVTLAEGENLWIGAQPVKDDDWQLLVYDTADPDAGVIIPEGAEAVAGKLRFEFTGIEALPAAVVDGVPGAGDQPTIVEMANDAAGTPFLTVLGATGSDALYLYPGQPVTVGSREYTFEGTREFTGISVRRDQGDTIIWVATGLLLLGLLITFYVPRRRLWVRADADGIRVASLAEKSDGFEAEMRSLERQLGLATAEDDRRERY